MLTVREHRARMRWQLLWLLAALAVLLGLAAAWAWSPLRMWLDMDLVVVSLRRLGYTYGLLAAICSFALAVAAAVPLIFLTLVTMVAFGPWAGLACSLAGALIGASISYVLGRYLGREVMERLGGVRVNELSRRLAKRGVLAVVAVRMVPAAPFAVVNMIAGASHIRLRDLLLGTAIGMMPATLGMMLFMEQIITALKKPNTLSFLVLALVLGLIVLGVWGVRRWLRHSVRTLALEDTRDVDQPRP